MTTIENRINTLLDEQGWTSRQVDEMAYGFIINTLPQSIQESFVTFLLQLQQTENAGMDEEEDIDLIPDHDFGHLVSDEQDITVLTDRLRELGCAVTTFTAEEMTAPDGTALEAREVEEDMSEAGQERIEFIFSVLEQSAEDGE